jgi:hypothetical protein
VQSIHDQDAYERMVYHWGEAYAFSYDPAPGVAEPHSAQRRDNEQGVLTARDPEKLTDKVYRNYLQRPVPRDIA